MIKLNNRNFYFIGIILFCFAVFGSLWSLIYTWKIVNIGTKIYSISSLLFQLLLIWLFYTLWAESPKEELINDEEIERIVNQYSKK